MKNRERIAELLHRKKVLFIGQGRAIFEGTLTQECAEAIVSFILKEIGYTRQPEYEPVELEVLGDEEFFEWCGSHQVDRCGETRKMEDCDRVVNICEDCRAQATIQKNQKGQLFRLKEVIK